MYAPGLGRFTTPDPLGSWGDPANLGNAYVYLRNNPFAGTDPYGLLSESYPYDVLMSGKAYFVDVPVGLAKGAYSFLAAAGNIFIHPVQTVTESASGVGTIMEMVTGDQSGTGSYIYGNTSAALRAGLREIDRNEAAQARLLGNVVSLFTPTALTRMGQTTAIAEQTGRAVSAARAVEVAMAPGQVAPRLTARLEAWRAYQARGGELGLDRWIQRTQQQYGGVSGGYKSGYGNWLRSIESTHGNSRLSQKTAHLYRLEDQRGNLLRWGVTQDLQQRYSQSYLSKRNLLPVMSGRRSDMLDLERMLVEVDPGPLNFEPWAGLGR